MPQISGDKEESTDGADGHCSTGESLGLSLLLNTF